MNRFEINAPCSANYICLSIPQQEVPGNGYIGKITFGQQSWKINLANSSSSVNKFMALLKSLTPIDICHLTSVMKPDLCFWSLYHDLEKMLQGRTSVEFQQLEAKSNQLRTQQQQQRKRLECFAKIQNYTSFEFLQDSSSTYELDMKLLQTETFRDFEQVGFFVYGDIMKFYQRILHDCYHPGHQTLIMELNKCFGANLEYGEDQAKVWMHMINYYSDQGLTKDEKNLVKLASAQITPELVEQYRTERLQYWQTKL